MWKLADLYIKLSNMKNVKNMCFYEYWHSKICPLQYVLNGIHLHNT